MDQFPLQNKDILIPKRAVISVVLAAFGASLLPIPFISVLGTFGMPFSA